VVAGMDVVEVAATSTGVEEEEVVTVTDGVETVTAILAGVEEEEDVVAGMDVVEVAATSTGVEEEEVVTGMGPAVLTEEDELVVVVAGVDEEDDCK